jgi:hypothetical protein
MAYFTLIDDAATQSISGGLTVNRSFNRQRNDNRQLNIAYASTNASVRNRGVSGNTVSGNTVLLPEEFS